MNQIINRRILAILARKYPNYREYFSKIYKYVEKYPNQRFGQICCNYVFPDYREQPSDLCKEFLTTIFKLDCDPFFEESLITLKTLYYGK